MFHAFQKMRARYHKYKGRYVDLAQHYKELEHEKEKVKVFKLDRVVLSVTKLQIDYILLILEHFS